MATAKKASAGPRGSCLLPEARVTVTRKRAPGSATLPSASERDQLAQARGYLRNAVLAMHALELGADLEFVERAFQSADRAASLLREVSEALSQRARRAKGGSR